MRKVILIEPHPDDIFLGMYCYARKHIFGNADRIYFIQLTSGEGEFFNEEMSDYVRNFTKPKVEEIKIRRWRETLEFTKHTGITNITTWNMPDGKVKWEDVYFEIAYWLRRRSLKSEDCEVFVTSMHDKHPDHIAAAVAVSAFDWYCRFEYQIDDGFTPVPGHLICGGDGWTDFENYMEVRCDESKVELFEKLYPSQWESLQRTRHPSLFKRMETERILR